MDIIIYGRTTAHFRMLKYLYRIIFLIAMLDFGTGNRVFINEYQVADR